MDCKLTSIKATSVCRRAGMTLTEVMVAMGAGCVILLVIGSLSLWCGRSFAAMANYADLDNASRNALDRMTRDVRQVDCLLSFATNQLTFRDFDDQPLQFRFDSSAKTLTRVKAGIPETLLSDCTALEFSIYQRNPKNGTYDQYPVANGDVTTCKLVQVSWICSRKLLPTDLINSESVQTAKIVIRNQ
jgi:prepilin-type N-terminal cleavage/methylation domain-containing protein